MYYLNLSKKHVKILPVVYLAKLSYLPFVQEIIMKGLIDLHQERIWYITNDIYICSSINTLFTYYLMYLYLITH